VQRGCDLLISPLNNTRPKDRSLVALDSAYG
jgi:hypothetical protein